MQHVEGEIFHHENDGHLILAYKYSGYVMTKHITDKSRQQVTNQLEDWFKLLGWPHSIGTKKILVRG